MSIWNSLDVAEQERQIAAQSLSVQTEEPIRLAEDEVGAGEGLGRGMLSGAVRVGSAFDMAAGGLAVGIDAITGGTELQDTVFAEHDATFGRAKKALTPKADEVTTAGQIAFGLSQSLTELAAGGPRTLVATEQLNTAEDFVNQGVDANTAQGAGLITGTANAIGVALPGAVGNTLTAKVLSGMGINVAIGAAAEGGQKVLLDANDYDALADQIDPFDLKARSIDAVMGAAFGGIAHLGVRDASPAEKNAAATLNLSAQTEAAAPGVPADITSQNAHMMAMDKAQDDLMSGRPVDVSAELEGATFRPKRPRGTQQEAAAALDAITREEQQANPDRFTSAPEDLGQLLEQRLATDHTGAVAEYATIDGTEGGRLLNTDLARELSAGYRANRTRSADVHEPASAFIKRLYEEKLAAPTPAGLENTVLFTAGGTGAGKTTGLAAAGDRIGKPEIIYDTNMNTLDSAVKKIEQAFAAGRNVTILYTYRDAVDAFQNGALPRAARMEKELGTGRTVPISEHIKTHVGASKVMRQLFEKYGDDERFALYGVDNSRGQGNAALVDIADLPEVVDNQLHGQLTDVLNQARQKGEISPGIYRGFLAAGRETPQPQGSLQGDGRAVRSGSESGQLPEGLNPDQLRAAEEAILANPSALAIDEATGQHVPAGELLANLDNEIKQADQKRNAFMAAAACFLRGGDL